MLELNLISYEFLSARNVNNDTQSLRFDETRRLDRYIDIHFNIGDNPVYVKVKKNCNLSFFLMKK